MVALGSFFFRVIAIQPEPVPRSRTVRCFGLTWVLAGLTPGKIGLPQRDNTASMICSVSGRGVRTFSFT